MKKTGASLILASFVSAAFAQTNAPASRSLSLQDCIAQAIQHNFDVRVERYEPLISQLGVEEAYAGYDPLLSLSGQHAHNNAGGFLGTNGVFLTQQITENNTFNSSLGGSLPSGATYNLFGNVGDTYEPYPESASGQVGVNVTQPLLKNLWIDSTRLAVVAAKNQVKQSVQGLRLQLITTVSAVENAYYELIYARENLNVEQQALDLAQTQLDQDRQRVEVGSLAPLDVQQDDAQVAQSRANLIAAQFTLESDQNTLKNLITDSYLQWHDVDIAPAATLEAVRQLFDVQDSWSKGMAARPDLLQARLTLEQQGIQLKYDRNQIFPQLDLTGSYGFNGAGSGYNDTLSQYQAGDRPFYSYGAQVSVPLSNAHARDAYKTDQAVEQQYLLKLKQLEQNVMVQIDDAVKQAQSALESVDATKEARIYAQAALDAEQKKYAVGKSTTFTVLQLQNNLTAARSQEIRALANYQEALTNLAQQEGSTLERRNVDVTVK
jgi:HAE1 family hydrophobic/amphiphilic exporter-1